MAEKDLEQLKIDKSKMTYGGRRTRRPIIGIGILLIIVLAVITYFFLINPTIQVEAGTVSLMYPSQSFTLLNASGYVVAQRKAAVSSKATGRLEWLGVEEGSTIKKGEVIARLEDRDVVATRDQAAANLKNLEAALVQARAELDDATVNFNRSKDLVAKGFISRMDYDTADARYKRAQAGVSGAESAIKAAEAALKAAEVVVEYTKIRAPFDAVVLTKDANVGDVLTPFGSAVNAKAAVVTVADMSSLEVEADVSEANLAKVNKGQSCEIQLDALPDKRFRGQVHMIVPTADRSKASVMVKVSFLDKDPRILPEMSAKVAFLEHPVSSEEEKPRVALPSAALVSGDGGQRAFVVVNGRVKEVPVRTGAKIGEMAEVIDGVKAGDKVVLNPPSKLRNGSKISIKEG